jgi:multiple sugar transport system ATP-binding protein
MATVTFDGVWKKFGEVVAVNDLNLEINDGEFMVLVGPSGCGKTTSLRMIAGLEEISEGSLSIGDRVVNHVAPKDRDIAMVFQSYALYPHMTVRDNMAFGLKLRKTPKDEIERRVNEAAAMLSCQNLLDRKPRELSGGQRQRVALGRAIVREPAVFLMDEPLSNLDAKLRVQTRAEIARLHQRLGTTTVYVTHDQVEAMTMGQRIAVMSEARLQQVGSPQELYDHPDNRFVAGFIGSPSMNFLEVDVTRTGDAVQLKGDGIDIPLPDHYMAGFKSFTGNKLVVGVRPEHLDVEAPPPSGSLSGNADVVEYLGNEELIHLSVGGHDIVALIGSEHHVKPGDDLTLNISLDKVHLFDPETTLAIGKERDEATIRRGGAARKDKAPKDKAPKEEASAAV